MIKEFQGKYRWLSNFTILEDPIEFSCIYYKTVEHFYVAMKTFDRESRIKIAAFKYPGQAKRFGRKLTLREDWDDKKEEYMEYAIEQKFSKYNPILRQKLMKTGTQHIQEGNRWGDKYWGVCLKTGEGENRLGKIIMKVRKEIIKGNK